jgi:hypothetical protein
MPSRTGVDITLRIAAYASLANVVVILLGFTLFIVQFQGILPGGTDAPILLVCFGFSTGLFIATLNGFILIARKKQIRVLLVSSIMLIVTEALYVATFIRYSYRDFPEFWESLPPWISLVLILGPFVVVPGIAYALIGVCIFRMARNDDNLAKTSGILNVATGVSLGSVIFIPFFPLLLPFSHILNFLFLLRFPRLYLAEEAEEVQENGNGELPPAGQES